MCLIRKVFEDCIEKMGEDQWIDALFLILRDKTGKLKVYVHGNPEDVKGFVKEVKSQLQTTENLADFLLQDNRAGCCH